MYYKPLENLNTADTVHFKTIGESEPGKFGVQHQCDVVVNGEDMTWTLSEAKHSQLQEAGFRVGDTVTIQKWKDGVKKGYNFTPASSNEQGDALIEQAAEILASQPPARKEDLVEIAKEIIENQPPIVPRDEVGEKIGRGQSLNLASQFLLYEACGGTQTLNGWLETLEVAAKAIEPHQQKYVNGGDTL